MSDEQRQSDRPSTGKRTEEELQRQRTSRPKGEPAATRDKRKQETDRARQLRQAAEEALRESHELFSQFMRHSPIYAYIKEVTSTESRVLHASDNYQQMIGISGRDMMGKTMSELFPAELAEKITADDWSVVANGVVLKVDEDLNGRNYTSIKFPIFQGDKTLLAGYTIDITERKRAEEALKESEEKYRSLFEHMLDGYAYCQMLYDDQGHPVDFLYLDVNSAFEQLTGLRDVVGKTVSEVIPGTRESAPELLESYGRVALTGKPEEFEIDFQPLNKWLSISVYSPARGYFVAVFDDITDRKQAEEALRESEAKYRQLVESLNEGIWMIDEKAVTTFVNPRMVEMLGYTVEEMLGRHLFSFMDEQGVQIAKLNLARRQQGIKEQHDFEFLRKDGTRIYASLETAPITDLDGNYRGAIAGIVDITERKRAEEALRESEEKYRSLVENANEAIFVAQDDKLVFINPMTAEMIGRTPEELLSQPFVEFIHPDDRALIIEHHTKRLGGAEPPSRYPFRVISRSGQIKWAELNTVRIQWAGKPATLNFLIDIGARKRLEQETARKITGELTAGIAHQIRNPLFVISLSVQSIEKKLPAKDPQRRLTRAIINKVHKLDEVTADLVHLGKYHELHITDASLRRRLELALILVRASAKTQRVKIVQRYRRHLPRAWIDVGAMDEVFANLLTNALEAMPEGGLLTVETDLDQERKELLVRIQDSGCGISKTAGERIFIPFFTTKESGSGLGLVFCRRIVEEHGGTITLESEEGKGTKVTVRLPLAKEPERE